MKLPVCKEENENHYRLLWLANTLYSPSFYLACLTITTLFCFHLLSHNTAIHYQANMHHFNPTNKDTQTCDIFKGQWIPDLTASLYTNYSCTTIPYLRNCFFHGRKDTDFLQWRWKPHHCELPRFDPQRFLSAVRGKKMAFIGDSLSRNQLESLLCLLSTVETPEPIGKVSAPSKDDNERFTSGTWEFRKYNFTLMALWSQFLVSATEVIVNDTATGSFNLQLDRVDTNWLEKLPLIDYAVFSDAQWFFRPNYLYEGGNLIGCVYCQEPNITDYRPGLAIQKAFRAAFKAINECKECNKIFTLLRTYSPAHFENGEWNTGGGCNRTRPMEKEEVNKEGPDWEYRKIQIEEIEMARNAGDGRGNRFEVVDITEMMLMRPDGHPGVHRRSTWMKGYNDCVHWCLPGPIDTWNQLLLHLIT